VVLQAGCRTGSQQSRCAAIAEGSLSHEQTEVIRAGGGNAAIDHSNATAVMDGCGIGSGVSQQGGKA
jgi:hypothetical protein